LQPRAADHAGRSHTDRPVETCDTTHLERRCPSTQAAVNGRADTDRVADVHIAIHMDELEGLLSTKAHIAKEEDVLI